MMVLHDAKIMVIGTPQQLYKNPENKLIASFFDEFNEIKNHGIVYANQLKVVDKSNLKAEAFLTSFFKVKLKQNGLRTVKYRTQPSANYKLTEIFQNHE